mgnify:CR=1 FL=1
MKSKNETNKLNLIWVKKWGNWTWSLSCWSMVVGNQEMLDNKHKYCCPQVAHPGRNKETLPSGRSTQRKPLKRLHEWCHLKNTNLITTLHIQSQPINVTIYCSACTPKISSKMSSFENEVSLLELLTWSSHKLHRKLFEDA